jgi:hypothetical protein
VRHRTVAEGNHQAGDNHREAAAGDNHRAGVAGDNHRAAVADSHPAAATDGNHPAAVDSYRGEAEGWSAVAAVAVDYSWTPSNVDTRFIAALVTLTENDPHGAANLQVSLAGVCQVSQILDSTPQCSACSPHKV